MWAELYGTDPVDQLYTFEGEGFDAWNGRTVFARVTGGTASSAMESDVVVGGQISIETSISTAFERFGNPRTVYLFVDLNGDGICTADSDHAQAVWLERLGSAFSTPNFIIPGTATKLSSGALCDQF